MARASMSTFVAALLGLGVLVGAAPAAPTPHPTPDLRALDTRLAALRARPLTGPARPMAPADAEALIAARIQAKEAAVQDFERRTADTPEMGARLQMGLRVRRAEALDEMNTALHASWVPTSLTGDERELYVMRLEDRAYPYAERTLAAARGARARGGRGARCRRPR